MARLSAKMVLSTIRRKCEAVGLIRHINGDVSDNRVDNLQWVKFRDIFKHPDWVIDYCTVLTERETAIVDRLRAFREVRVQ